jgi:hypothetical protein
MRPVSGFDRPAFQWLFIGLGIALIAIAAIEGRALVRARKEIAALRAADLNHRIELDRVNAHVSREQAAREALALELARQRGGGVAVTQPTLTLSPLTKRGSQPPEPTVAKPAEHQTIQLRLVLPSLAQLSADARYTITMRSWSGGDTVWSRSGLGTSTVESKRMVTCFISGDVFAPGAYEISLARTMSGAAPTDVASYEVAVHP